MSIAVELETDVAAESVTVQGKWEKVIVDSVNSVSVLIKI